jgi:DNA-binding XRE family transcriptional regulator
VVPLLDGSDVGVSLRRLCEATPVDFASQTTRLARAAKKGACWAVVAKMTTTGADGKQYTMLVLPRRSIPMWAATVSLAKVREDLRPGATKKLARDQDECAEALADRFLGPRYRAAPAASLPQAPAAAALEAAGEAIAEAIPSAYRARDFETLRTAMAMLEASLPPRSRTAQKPKPPQRPRRACPRPAATAAPLSQGAQMLRTWREREGYSQTEAAHELGVAQSAYCDWEHGLKTPRLEGLLRIQERAGIPLAAFTQGVPADP